MTSTRSRARTRTGVALLALTVAALSACGSSDDGQDVASVAGATGRPDEAEAASTDGIGDFVDCMVDGGVPALIGEDGGLSFSEDVNVGFLVDDANLGTMGLEVDGEDVSETLRACQEKYPDVEPFAISTDMSPEEEAEQNAAGTEWATCARESGFPDFADPQDGTVMLPDSLTAEQATGLGRACPMADFGPFGLGIEEMPEEQMDGALRALLGDEHVAPSGEQD